MTKTTFEPRDPTGMESAADVEQRERAVSNRETWVRAREMVTGEHDAFIADREGQLNERETVVQLREEAVRVQRLVDSANAERDRLLAQLRATNERLVIATIHADEAAEAEQQARIAAEDRSKKLESQGRAKNEFLAMLGHELRNPLAPIVGALDLMEMRDPKVLANERSIIHRQVRQLMQLVEDMLDLSRSTEGKIELHCEPVALDAVVWAAVDTVKPLIIEKHHNVHVDVPAQLVVNGDPLRLNQIVSNLLANAAKYTQDNGQIEVTGMATGSMITLRVRDNGIGISPEMLPHVFEPFSQEPGSRSFARGGLGLGLAIVHRLVTLHRGTVFVNSAGRGCGTEFLVSIPAV